MQYRYEREQSEPAGTCEKQRYCSFSLRGEASESVPRFIPILLRKSFDFLQLHLETSDKKNNIHVF